MKLRLLFLSIIVAMPILSFGQTLDVNFTGSCGSYSGVSDTQTSAQSFTVGLNGSLSKVAVGVSTDACTQTSEVKGIAKIYLGTCSGTLLTTQSFSLATGSSLSMKEITFSSPISVTAGQTYTLELNVEPNQPCTVGGMGNRNVFMRWHLENTSNCGGSYEGGTFYDNGCSAYPADAYIQTYISNILSVNDFNYSNKLIVSPNPTDRFINISGLNKVEKYVFINVLGNEIKSGIVTNSDKIDIQDLTNGIYYLKIGNKSTFKILKN